MTAAGPTMRCSIARAALSPCSKPRVQVVLGICLLLRARQLAGDHDIVQHVTWHWKRALAPERQERGLVRAQVFLETRIERDVASGAEDKVELDLLCLGSVHEEGVQQITVGRH